MINLTNFLNDDLIREIHGSADSRTKRDLSMVDRRIRALLLNAVRSLRIFPPPCPSFKNHPSATPEDILVRVIRRYPNIENISFGPEKNWGGSGEFQARDVPYIEALISYLESDTEKHPLNSVKKITCNEIIRNFFGDFKKTKELNTLFLSAIGHKSLEKVRLTAYHIGSILTGDKIQPVLTNSPNLKSFVFSGHQSDQTVSLSFARQSQISKVKLLHWRGSASTIESLRKCTKLEELVIDHEGYSSSEIKEILTGEHCWNLKRLELGQITPSNDAELDAITKKLPNLECLDIKLKTISSDGMELLGRNCPNLKVLCFNNENVTDSSLDRLTKHLPHLEIISFDQAYNITEVGIAAIARNCKNLRFIQVVHHNQIEKSGIDALIKNCPDLKVVGFSNGGPVSLEGMYQMAKQMPNLRYVELYSIRELQKNQIEEFYHQFPQLKKIPYTSSVKKLQNLTI